MYKRQILDRHPLEELLGIRTEEMDAAPDHRVNSISFEGKSYKTGCLREISHVIPGEGAEVLASYESDYYAGCPALTRKSYGSGKAYYLACETEEAFLKALYAGLAEENGIGTEFTGRLPYGVTVSHRDCLLYTSLLIVRYSGRRWLICNVCMHGLREKSDL